MSSSTRIVANFIKYIWYEYNILYYIIYTMWVEDEIDIILHIIYIIYIRVLSYESGYPAVKLFQWTPKLVKRPASTSFGEGMSWAKLAKKSSTRSKLPSASTYPEDHQCVAVLAAPNKIEKRQWKASREAMRGLSMRMNWNRGTWAGVYIIMILHQGQWQIITLCSASHFWKKTWNPLMRKVIRD